MKTNIYTCKPKFWAGISILLFFVLLFSGGKSWGQVNITPIRTDVSGFSTWTDTDVTGTTYLQLLKSTSSTISPAMNFDNYTGEALNFKARTYGGTNTTENEIFVAVSTNNGTDWTDIGSRTPTNTTLTAVSSFDLSAYTGTQIKIKFYVKGTNNTIGAGIDEIAISGISSNPSVIVGTITAFGNQTVNTTSSEKNYTVSGTNLTSDITITPPSGFEISTGSGAGFVATNPITLSQSGGAVASTTIYVRFKPTAIQAYSGNITHTTTGGNNPNVAVSGTGVAPANPVTFTATTSSSTQINLASTANSNGNDIVVVFNSTGTFTTPTSGVAAGNIGDAFADGTILYKGSPASLTNHTGLTPSTAYYYKAFSYDASNFYSSGFAANATTNGIDAPIATSADNVTSNGFTANWGTVTGASSYRLDVSSVSDFGLTIKVNENFSSCTAGTHATPDGSNIANSLDTYLQTIGWTGTSIYQAGGEIKLGASGTKGSITTKTIDLSTNSGNATLTFDLAKYGSDATVVQIFHATDGTTFNQVDVDITAPATMTTQTISITGGTANSKIMIAAKNASSNRFYLDNLNIKQENATAILSGYNDLTVNGTNQSVSGLTPNTSYYYRVRAYGTSGTSINSNTISVNTLVSATSQFTGATSNNWEIASNWDNGVPGSTTDVTIPGGITNYPTITSTATIASLTLESGASIIGEENLTITGTTTYKKDIDANKWHLISSPVSTGATAANFQPTTGNGWLRSYTDGTGWGGYITVTATPLVVGEGYALYLEQPKSVVLTGTLNNGNYNLPLLSGWNMLGNPYASGVDFALATKNNVLSNTMYLWDQAFAVANAGGYVSYNTNSSVGNAPGVTSVIPAFQGFFVEATAAGSVAFANANRTHNAPAFYKSGSSTEIITRMKVSNAQGYTDYFVVCQNPSAGNGYESYDSKKFLAGTERPEMFAYTTTGEKLTIDALETTPQIIPMSVIAPQAGSLTFTAFEFDNSTVSIKLEDNQTGSFIDLRTQPSYSFSAIQGENNNRFFLHIGSTTGIEENDNNGFTSITANDKQIVVTPFGGEKINRIDVVDATGKLLSSVKASGNEKVTISANFATGVYMVRVYGQGKVMTGKVTIW